MAANRWEARKWAYEEFGGADLGDQRRRSRLLAIATQLALTPDGRISRVFRGSADRQGAYDFVESDAIDPVSLTKAMAEACIARAAAYETVFVPIDGSSLTLLDRAGAKGFGSVGARDQLARGLKVMDAIAVSPDGVPLGCCWLRWWTRSVNGPDPIRYYNRPLEERETYHWLQTIASVDARLRDHAPRTRAWFQLDREGDAWPVLCALSRTKHAFTIRSRDNRRVLDGTRRGLLRPWLRRARSVGSFFLEVSAGRHRRARSACLEVRARRVVLDLRDPRTGHHTELPVNAVWVHERHTTPRGEQPLHWILLTSEPIDTLEQCRKVIFGYSQRWRVEDFHKTWKTGVCDVEATQLRRPDHVIRWATLLAAVAIRVERIKHLARERPELPASVELSDAEIRALILMKRKYKKKTETIPDSMPTIADAALWLAEMGGYTGKSSGGPPGSITLARGLERVRIAAEAIELFEESRRKG
jgi:hypothetical protein